MATKKTQKTEELPKIPLRQIVFLAALSFIVATSIYMMTSFATKLFYEQPRAARVHAIYDSLALPDTYIYQGGLVAGDKRVYKEDGTRSWASYQKYLRGANLDDVVKDLDQRITKQGFTLIDEATPDSPQVERHYKNDKNEYIRVLLYSKPRFEYFQNAQVMKVTPDQTAVDPNTGPIQVTIKVNLDNNNE